MNLAIDCFKLMSDDPEKGELYSLVCKLVAYLGAENRRRDMEHHIMILGNTSNQKDLDVDGTSFLLMNGNPLDGAYLFWWENFGIASFAPKIQCDRVFYPCGKLPVHYSGAQTALLYMQSIHRKSPMPPEMMRLFLSSSRKADRVITVNRLIEERMLQKIPGVEDRINLLPDIGEGKADPIEMGIWWTELFRQ
jgi:hypothetical protein